ncbi:hypothetical protein CPI83_29605 (plasmid) [Rhodococcus sp. H-CA8f]|uniref:hypothetical protein n=1 Tax=Rhodococcus sp. H-CA8f TaxID=1727214 RepID=UPI000BE3C5B8|nr:hypothetical protein [Rhodococcus sp. H-CA8f]ATI36359.1 hypothetical protein CPI83_29605 [Rhodococcus sp. H-CA8f]
MTAAWGTGQEIIRKLLDAGDLEQVSGNAADGSFLLTEARSRCASARTIKGSDPTGAYVMTYEAARHTATALLTQQGLRITSKGGHIAVVEAVLAQFGKSRFLQLSGMRRRRNDLEYPRDSSETAVTIEEVDEALDYVEGLLEAAEMLLPKLGLWS